MEELSECCRTGCMYDGALVWAADECSPSPMVQRRQLDAEGGANADAAPRRQLDLEPTALGCNPNSVTLNFGAKNEPATYWPSGDCDCDPETPCRQDVSGTCNPTTWCDACCETGECAPGVSCEGYEDRGGADQENCCAPGSTMCTRPEYFLAEGGKSCTDECSSRGPSWQVGP